MITIQGYRGHLVAASHLAAEIARSATQPHFLEGRQRLAAALEQVGSLGPAAGPRKILEVVVVPLLRALELGTAHDVEGIGDVIAATVVPRDIDVSLTRRDSARTPCRGHGDGVLALVVTPWGDRLDRHWRVGVTEAQRRHATWCVVCNGVTVRIVDAARLYSRRFAELDLTTPLDDRISFAAFWRIAAATALLSGAHDPLSLHALVARSDQHAVVVCRSLRDGVLNASEQILGALIGNLRARVHPELNDSFEQALTICYRIVFLLFAEARGLVPLWHPVYRESYSIESLREIAEGAGETKGLWDALRAIARLAYAGCQAGNLRVTPFNGRLFAPARTPLAERRGLDDEAARRAILALSTRPAADRSGRERIAYGELDVEQLGSVYETLLDYRPNVVRRQVHAQRTEATVTLAAGSGVRKATGTFYTPQAIADHLVRRTLTPLVHGLGPDDLLQLRILDPAMGSGAFLVAACRFLSATYEDALVIHGRCHPRDIDEADRAAIRRLVAERCLYGVDLNPMAVQLARLSLWLATLAGDRPLSFLDHRLVVGNSLLGAWLTNLRRPPVPGRRHPPASDLPLFEGTSAAHDLRAALPIRFSLESTPNDTLEQVRAKERAFATLSSSGSSLFRWKRAANLWCAPWFDEGLPARLHEALNDAALYGTCALPARTASDYLSRVDAIAAEQRFVHWELEFPEVFFDERGDRLDRPGFDAVIGNPPWDMMRDDARRPSGESTDRVSNAAAVRFTRESGVYGAQSNGHANRYQLFTERAVLLTRAGGRFGLVLPSGLATDHGSAPLRRMLLSRCALDALVGVDNRRRIFPIHRSVRFLLATGTVGTATERIALRFGIDRPEDLHALEDASASSYRIRIARATLERLSGAALGIPDLRHEVDLIILEKAASLFAPLGVASGWNARFGRELNATDDRAVFRADRRGLPLVDGRHVEPFHVALDRSTRSVGVAEARRLLGRGGFDRPRLGYRDVASATNRTTLIAAILPAGCVSTHTVYCLKTVLPARDQQLLCGLFNSLVVNYLVRLRVSTHVTTAIVEHLPIPTRDAGPRTCREIAALARLLSRRTDVEACAALNARVAQLYQLTVDEFRHVSSTFPLVEGDVRSRALALLAETQRHGGPQR